jgi:hypothetical protein
VGIQTLEGICVIANPLIVRSQNQTLILQSFAAGALTPKKDKVSTIQKIRTK